MAGLAAGRLVRPAAAGRVTTCGGRPAGRRDDGRDVVGPARPAAAPADDPSAGEGAAPGLGGVEGLAAAIAPCFPGAEHGRIFGLSVALKRDGSVQRVFFGGDTLTSGERHCVQQHAVGQHFGGPMGVVELDARLDPAGPHLKRR